GFDRRPKIIARTVLPVHHDQVLWNVSDEIGMMQRDVAPEHQLPVVRLKLFANTIEMFKVNRTDTLRLSFRAALPFTKLKCLVLADVEKLSGEKFIQLFVPIGD